MVSSISSKWARPLCQANRKYFLRYRRYKLRSAFRRDTIGFYTNPADNGFTYFLMVVFFGLIVYRIITRCFFLSKDKNLLAALQNQEK